MIKRLILLLLFSLSFVSFGQNGVRVIDNKGTVVYVDPSKWFQEAGNLYNKNTNGNVAIGLDTSITDLGARLVVSNGGSTTLPALILKSPFDGVSTDDVLTWNSADGSVRKIDRTTLVAEPWYKVGTTTGATLNTDDVFIKGSANVGVIAPVTVASAGTKSKFAVAGGDAAINTVTVGLGGGQVSSNLAVGYQALYGNNNFFNGSFNNTAIGYQSLKLNTTGNNNIALGYSTLNNNSNGCNNIAIGTSALTASTGGLRNSAIGIGALKTLNGGNDNIGIGYNVGYQQTDGNGNIIIGNNINVPSLTTDNQMNIGNAIFGLNIGTTVGGAFVGIGTTAPTNLLEIKTRINGKSGLRFTNLTSTSPVTAAATTIGVDANGDVVATDATATAWKLIGNAGTSPTANFLGTTDAQDLIFRTNNIGVARFTSDGNSTIGTGAGPAGTADPAIVASVTSDSSVAQQKAKLTVAGGDASINGLTVGLGGGQVESNLAIGNEALYNGKNTSSGSLAIGYQALHKGGTYYNTAIGYQALYNASNGSYANTAIGYQSLYNTTGGYNNLGIGGFTLMNNTTGSGNIGIGYHALEITNGTGNVGIGINSLVNSTGNNNIALGYNSMKNLTSGDNNILIANNSDVPDFNGSNQLNIGNVIYGTGVNTTTVGEGSIGIGTTTPGAKLEVKSNAANASGLRLTNLTSMSPVTAGAKTIGVDANGDVVTTDTSANAWTLSGNSGTSPTTNFLGTTDDADLVFKRNNVQAGWIGVKNTAIGVSALPNNAGDFNVAVGVSVLQNNLSGVNNTGIGYSVLRYNTDGGNNTAMGVSALQNNTSGGNNTAMGVSALKSNSDGIYNTGIGVSALQNNTEGGNNTAMGSGALSSNTIGNQNVAIGALSLGKITNGSWNTGIGYQTGTNLISGTNNIMIGTSAGALQASGNGNIVIGSEIDAVDLNGNNQLNIGGSIYGKNLNDSGSLKIGIGTTNPDFTAPTKTDANMATFGVDGTVNATNYTSPVQTVTGGAWDLSKGANAKWVLAAGVNTLTLSNMKAGMYGTIIVTNTGTSTITFGGGTNKVINGGGGGVTLTLIDKAVDILSFMYDGEYFWWTVGNNYN